MRHPMCIFKNIILLSFLFLVACTHPRWPSDITQASATLEPKSGSIVTGEVRLSQENGKIILLASINGLSPNSEHGFHIHQIGDCSAPDASSAGPHFNPYDVEHGNMYTQPHHAGDMPNIKADAQGKANYKIILKGATLTLGKLSLIGKSIVIHQDPDDYHSQPAGNSGKRIACGVIK
jgi:Cu-Zn family superoxide dismutase